MNSAKVRPEERPAAELRVLCSLFFFSGFSSLIFENIFVRLLTYTFGNTAQAVSTVLAAFLGGLALGSFLFGRWIDRRTPSLKAYGILELLVALYGLLIPAIFSGLTRIYLGLHQQFHLQDFGLTAARFLLAAAAIGLPAALMGGTLPLLARFVAARGYAFRVETNRLYAWNTLGAATGTLVSAYGLLPLLGVGWTIGAAAAVNFGIFGSALVLPWGVPVVAPTAPESLPTPGHLPEGRRGAVLLIGACLTGSVALAYEVVWTHVQAFMIGSTVYAFGAMLFTILCGLGWGAKIVADRLREPTSWAPALATSQMLLGAAVLLTLPLWTATRVIFSWGLNGAYWVDVAGLLGILLFRFIFLVRKNRRRQGPLTWWERNEALVEAALVVGLLMAYNSWLRRAPVTLFITTELVRLFLTFGLLLIPAVLLGMSFPLLLSLAGGSADRAGENVGRIYAANTIGAILGSMLTGFVLLPRLGSESILRVTAVLNLGLGILFAVALVPVSRGRKTRLAAVTVAAGVVLAALVPHWSPFSMSSGSYVYFGPGWPIDRVLFQREDVEGGLTSVIEAGGMNIMLTNGKLQGDNGGERQAQVRFALFPMLFAHRLDRALVIGLGTGNSLRALTLFPLRKIDAAELSRNVIRAARGWFGDVNDGVFDRDSRVQVHVADGRNFLLLSQDSYDLITIEVTSIWIAGEADLYNREFYELCRRRLREKGVLQQWVQLHHMRTETLLTVLNTASQVFPHVVFFVGPEQGALVASAAPLEADASLLERWEGIPALQKELQRIGVVSLTALLGEISLSETSLGRALDTLPRRGWPARSPVSTDYRPILEYETPLGNSLPYDSAQVNRAFLATFRPSAEEIARMVAPVPEEAARNLLLAQICAGQGHPQRALEYLRQAGESDGRARALAGRIASAMVPSNRERAR